MDKVLQKFTSDGYTFIERSHTSEETILSVSSGDESGSIISPVVDECSEPSASQRADKHSSSQRKKRAPHRELPHCDNSVKQTSSPSTALSSPSLAKKRRRGCVCVYETCASLGLHFHVDETVQAVLTFPAGTGADLLTHPLYRSGEIILQDKVALHLRRQL